MKIEKDKWKHFFVGIAMGAVIQAFFLFILNTSFLLSTILSLVFSTVVAYGFELFSKFTGRGHYEVMDAVAAVIGAIIGISIVGLI